MVQLHLLSGKKAGGKMTAGKFPFRIGRSSQNHLALDDDGIWDQHLSLEFREKEGIHLATTSNAIATVNGKPVEKTILRNGDIITIGSAKIQFWLAPAPQYNLQLRENTVWALLILITIAQFVLICTFLH